MTQVTPPASVHPYDRVEDIMYILDADGRLTFVNAYALGVWNKQLHELLGQTVEEAFPGPVIRDVKDAIQQVLMTQQRTEFETFGLRQFGLFGVILYPDNGGVIGHVRRLPGDGETITSLGVDALTGCLTRTSFLHAQQALDLPHVLAIIDLNRLKAVNALRGHSGGDAYIRAVAHAVIGALPASALICRWGGDEFVVLVPGADQLDLNALLAQVNGELPRPVPGLEAFSVGMAVWDESAPYERAFALADEQLQLRKAQLNETTTTDVEVTSIVDFSQQLETISDPGDLIQHALNSLLGLLDFDQAVYAPWEGQDNYSSHQAVREGVPAPYPPLHVRVPIAHSGLVHQVQRTRQTAWSTDYPSDVENTNVILQQGIKSVVLTPVFSQGQIVATIVLRSVNRWHSITPQMRKVLELTALRLEHALELRHAVNEVRSTLEAGMLTLGLVLEARDFETSGHTTRTATMTAQLGEHLGLNAAALHHLRQGAYLHDLGKLSVPDEILKKPGSLSPDEWTVMQSHVLQGYDLAIRIPGLSLETLGVIRAHHERWDGRGYPDGLAGTAIPLAARIFAVCDVYDALISNRPYKRAWTREAAVAEIIRESGRHFDPEVVRAFTALHSGGEITSATD
jgi:diguanylate cyclase (GGDEF)-like protein